MWKTSGSASGSSHHVVDGLARLATRGSGSEDSSSQTSTSQGIKLGHIAELGALGATAYAKHKSQQAKADPANAEKHKKEEKLAGVVALGLTGYAAQEARRIRKEQKASETPSKNSNHQDKFRDGKNLLHTILK